MDHPVTIDAWTFDPGVDTESPEAYADEVLGRIKESAETGARFVLLPEYLWMGLLPFARHLKGIARLVWDELWPKCRSKLPEDVFVVAGTAPWWDPASGELRNRALISCGKAQDKCHLTPWETRITPGDSIQVHTFGGLRVAVVICLDIEVPELAVSLRRQSVDLILVPSATDSQLGVERVHRCASARAVELGCAVVVTHLTGRGSVELIDVNIGRSALYLPSQNLFSDTLREQRTVMYDSGAHRTRFTVDFARLRLCRQQGGETNPARLF